MTSESDTTEPLETLVNAQIAKECSRLPPMMHAATAWSVAGRLIPLSRTWRIMRGNNGAHPTVKLTPLQIVKG